MILFLILGIILGAAAVIFVLQNTAVVTASFFYWHVTASLALILLGTILLGIIITLLMILPSLVRDSFEVAALKRQKRQLEEEVARHQTAVAQMQSPESSSSVL